MCVGPAVDVLVVCSHDGVIVNNHDEVCAISLTWNHIVVGLTSIGH